MITAFPDVLLPDVLDFLELEWLLLCAMPVSRFWRNEAIRHPTYWRDITACDGKDGPVEYVQSVDMFLLRISRSHDRPIRVTVYLDDPSPVLESIAQHMPHIRALNIIAPVPRGGSVLNFLRRSPAPILENLTLRFLLDMTFGPPPIIPHDLFTAHAPALTLAHVENIALASTDFPPCLASVTTLIVHNSNPFAPVSLRRLPNVFEHCKGLRCLSIQGNILLDHTAFREARSWAGLTTLALAGPRLGAEWHTFRLPISQVPVITLENYSAHGVAALVEMLGNHLSVEFGPVEDMLDARVPINVFLRKQSDAAPHRVRRIDLAIPYDPPGEFPHDGISAFRRAPVVDAVVRLALSLHNWDGLVGTGYLVELRALETLVLMVERWDFVWSHPARLGCPSLQQLVFRAQPGVTGIPADMENIAAFVPAALKGAALPLEFEWEGLTMKGSTSDHPTIFK